MTEINFNKTVKIILWFAGLLLAAFLLYTLSEIIIILSISILLSLIFNPFVNFLEWKGLNRFAATLIVFATVGFLFYLGLSYLIPQFIIQMNQLISALHVHTLHEQIFSVEQKIYAYFPFFTLGNLTKKIEELISSGIVNSFDRISTFLTNLVSIIALLVIVPFITFYLLKDSKILLKGILHFMPNKYFEMTYWVAKRVSIQLARFVRGWIFDAAFVGVACGLGYYAIGVNNSLALGLISGLGHLVPYFGPLIGGIPAIVISIIQYGDLSHVPLITLLIISVYFVDNGFVQPYVFSKSVDMHPIVIILLIVTGSQLFGVIGMLLAIPLATVIRTMAKEIYFAFKNYKISRI
ncbi:MAG: AI-2E family transporter [Ignavibacteriaceae bacterium]